MFWLSRGLRVIRMKLRSIFSRFLQVPYPVWVLLGFSISYLLFFIGPVFLSTNIMQFPHYVPAAEHIGIDLKQTLSFSEYWVAADRMRYVRSNNYPPLASLLFTPLLGLKFPLAYKILTLSSVLSFAFITWLLPKWLKPETKPSSLPAVFCVTGLVSYGFQFELERGQFDVIAILPAFVAIWIFHRHNANRWIAYLLLSLSVQLKLYPLIFCVMLIDDWRDWRNNARRLLLFTLGNLLFLFAFGAGVFTDFLNATTAHILDPYIWIGNHSIRSAVTLGLRFADRHGWIWLDPYSGIIQILLLACVLGCILLIVLQAYRKRSTGLNPYLLLACTLGALLILPYSHDYRLSILAAPAVLFFLGETADREMGSPFTRVLRGSLILIASFAYSSTLFSFLQKPFVLANNFPALCVLLMVVTILAVMPNPRPQEPAA
jgi:hypothetical protein